MVMDVRASIRKVLNEWIDPNSERFITDAFFSPTINWYLQPHAIDRMNDRRNIQEITYEDIERACKKATPRIFEYFSDKRNHFKGAPGFKFMIIDKNNYYLSLGCLVERHDTLRNIDVSIRTVLMTGDRLKMSGYVAVDEPEQLTIEV